MKKIALINPRPKGFRLNLDNIFSVSSENIDKAIPYKDLWSPFTRWSGLSQGLLIIAALTPDCFDIELIDENFEDINFNEKYDIVAISTVTQQATRAYQIADEFRKRGVKVVIGGIHATVLPEEAKQHADSVVVGEAEETWPIFIEDFLNDNIQPFYRATRPVDLTKSPMPRYDLLKHQNYKIIWIQATRGCPRDCEFCVASNVYGTKYRHKTIDQVVKEVRYVKSICNTQIGFADDNMFIDKNYSTDLVKELIPLKIKWMAQTDISAGENEELLKLLKKSGCVMLLIGFESISNRGLESLDRGNWKLRQLDKYLGVIENIQAYGIGVLGAFIVGFDSDDASIFERTAEFIINNHLYASQITVLTPLPGTRLRERLIKEGRILSTEWDKYTFLDVNFMPKQMSPRELQNGIFEVYQRVYNKEVRLKIAKHFKDIYSKLADENK
jgi:radical SAM superfamily enzyme YgiQ (UPF0313 family)